MISKELLTTYSNSKGSFTMLQTKDDLLPLSFTKSYISVINPNITKGFYRHTAKVSNLICIKGTIRFYYLVNNHFEYFDVTEDLLEIVKISAEEWYGWKNLSDEPSWLLNICYEGEDNQESRQDPEILNGWFGRELDDKI